MTPALLNAAPSNTQTPSGKRESKAIKGAEPPRDTPSTQPLSPRNTADPPRQYIAARYGIGPTPCYACGTDQHVVMKCPKAKKGKCAVCGSEAHWARHCHQRFCPHPKERLNFQQICEAALTNPCVHVANAPYDCDEEGPLSEDEGFVMVSEDEGVEDGETFATARPVAANYVTLAAVSPLETPAFNQTSELKVAARLLGSELMHRWGHFLKKVCVDASTSIFPVCSPQRKGQLMYEIRVEGHPVIALLDHGASHSFMSYQ